MGNQLFQVAAALEIVDGDQDRLRLVAPPNVDLRLLESLLGRDFERASARQMRRGGFLPPILPTRAKKTLKRARRHALQVGERLGLVPRSGVAPLPSERYGAVGGEVRRVGSRAFLRGYFQDIRWSPEHSISLARTIMTVIDRRADRSDDLRPVVHIRGGDYRGLGWILGDGYYRTLVESGFLRSGEVVDLVGDDPVEIARVRGLLDRSGVEARELPTIADPTEAALRDFASIANAPRLVMSNSTFCWWATRAGDTARSRRRVAYPSGWIDGDASTRLSRALRLPEWEPFPSPLLECEG